MIRDVNQLVESLPRTERARLLAVCEPVELQLSQVLGEAGSLTRHVYFPTSSFISVISRVDAHPGLEVGMIGHEGMLGAHVALGMRRDPLKSLVQGPGETLRAGVAPFAAELQRSEPLRRLLSRYVYVQMARRANAAGCLRYHEIGPRLARWLLMSHDRAGADHLHVTHEFLAYMLGVRREGVTVAAGSLQRQGWISYHRGEVSILDRSGLLGSACSCYDADVKVYGEVMLPGR